MKRFILFIFSLFLILGLNIRWVSAKEIYKEISTTDVAPGVTLTKVKAFYAGYDLTYSYITADLKNPDVGLSLLKSSKGINERETVANLAKTENNIVAAINADFFAMSTNSYSQGIEYKNGRLLQSPIDTASFAGGFLYDNELLLSNIDFHIMIVAPDLEYREVYRLNKPMELYGALLMYTPDYNGGYSPAPGNGVVEMIVQNNVVVGFNRSTTPVKIPDYGYVLEISEMDPFLSSHFKEGDTVGMEMYITPTLENLTMAFGGGSLLLKNGQIVKFTNNAAGNNPRSAIGTDASGTKVYLMAVDGRQAQSRGVSQTELAELMKEIGCTEAMNLDGGGSSYMVSKIWGDYGLKTINSPTETRKVINAIGVKSNANSSGKLEVLKLEIDNNYVYSGDKTTLKVSGADGAYNPVAVDKDKLTFNYSDLIDGNFNFSAKDGGVYEIYAMCDGVKSNSVTVTVLENITGIDAGAVYELGKPGDTAEIHINVYDDKGNYVSTPWKSFDISTIGDAAVFENGNIIAKKAGEAILKVKKGGIEAYSKIKVEGDGAICTKPQDIVSDPANKKVSEPEKTFAYTAVADTEKNLYDVLYTKKLAKTLKNYDRVAMLGNQVHPYFDDIYAVNYDKYMCLKKEGVIFLSLPTKNGSVRSADSSAYDKIRADLSSSKEKNVFVTTDGYFNFSGIEFEALKSVLKESGKNVFIIQRENSNSVRIIDGIKIFYVTDNKAYTDLLDATKSLKMLVFEIKNDNVYYTFENVFEF